MRILVVLALAVGCLAQVALAQKPPSPSPPPPPPTNPGRTGVPPVSPNPQPLGSRGDLVMFLDGRVATDDGTPLPNDVLIERVCDTRVRQQVHASPTGDFSMRLGVVDDTLLDATGEGQDLTLKNTGEMGVSRRELINCELRASVSGFRSNVVNLMEITAVSSTMDVGAIMMHRAEKVKGLTLDASLYKAPKDARKAFEKGLEAERKGRLADARQYFEKAVELYPKNASAWYQLGSIMEKQAEKEPARAAYVRATTIDSKFLPPYLPLASMAFEAGDWTQVLNLTNHVMDHDPLRYANVSGYILDLDSLDYSQAYFYNAAANYQLNRMEAAEKSGLKAERLDVRPRYPQLHLLLAEIFARKNDYATAISETKMYLELVPHAQDANQVRERLASYEKLSGLASSGEKTEHN